MKNLDKLALTKDMNKDEIYGVVLDDLKNIYNFYKVVYLMVCDKFFSERLVASFLFYLGELKKMKIIVNKKFEKEDNTEKDSKEAMRFYQYSLNKNPYNIRVYFNIGLIMRECLKDYTNSSYWFVRSLAAPGSDIKNFKSNLEMDFNIIRKVFIEKEYLVDTNPAYLNYDVEYLPLALHRLMGILYMSIDTDKIDELTDMIKMLLGKILKYFYNINEDLKLELETKAMAEQISLMTIFNFHYTLNSLAEYPNNNERIVLQSSQSNQVSQISDGKNKMIDESLNLNNSLDNNNSGSNNSNNNSLDKTDKEVKDVKEKQSSFVNNKQALKASLKYELYNHNLLSKFLDKDNTSNTINNINNTINTLNSNTDNNLENKNKYGFKYVCKLINVIIKEVLANYNQANQLFSEKILLIFFYWFSINYDVVNNLVLLEKETLKYLEHFNFLFQKNVSKIPSKENMYQVINYYITPIEISFLAFMPLTRFFEIYGKKSLLKIEESGDQNNINKIILAHFLNLLGVNQVYDEEYENSYLLKQNELKTTTVIKNKDDEDNTNISNINILSDSNLVKQSRILNVTKNKPLILLDMSNIAMRHGNSEKFSTKGIKICMDFFIKNGHEVSGFLPEYLFKEDIYRTKGRGRVIPDDIPYLKNIHSKGYVIQTPSQDYDDSYNIQYCKSKNAYFVTNDLYRDYTDKISDHKTKEIEKRWIVSKRISYTFNKDEFIPGPDSEFFKEFNFSQYMKSITGGDINK